MRDDELMDQLLTDTMAADVPQLSPAFDARLMRRVRPRRLTSLGRAIIVVYIVGAVATTAWFMRDLPAPAIVAALAISATVAIGASAYGRKLAFRD